MLPNSALFIAAHEDEFSCSAGIGSQPGYAYACTTYYMYHMHARAQARNRDRSYNDPARFMAHNQVIPLWFAKPFCESQEAVVWVSQEKEPEIDLGE